MEPCLLLNTDARPKSFIPMSMLSWQEAIRMIYLGTGVPLHHYEHWQVHSPTITMTVPSVLMLKSYVKFRPYVQVRRGALFLRDEYKCAYCANIFKESELTIDHVVPRSHGGGTNWRNCVAACSPCNVWRGNDIRIRPAREPYQPSHQELVSKRKRFPIIIPAASWIDYLDWSDQSLVKVHSLK
jgi:5-methylcytosine-specific restriction endonuclease McrA